ncbi:hypothetical protein GGQ91_002495 [Methylobacterium fujisawaense]|uniref:Uncharacterized protein n=1 Tax=Methylobacterium fujisawaense TaxID=107400 RepID=A0ABR6DAI6_9HYPH|nr:hypothetical protein [Methylobacterium fujisawaense]
MTRAPLADPVGGPALLDRLYGDLCPGELHRDALEQLGI